MTGPAAQVPLEEPADVVVGGTGAGGGNVIRELCMKGVTVVALEPGPRIEDPDREFEEDEWAMFHKLAWLDPVLTAGTDVTGLAAWLCKTVGGTTTHWAGAALRFQPHELKARTTYGDVAGAALVDWPLELDELLPFYEEAERRLGVAGRVLPPAPGNTNFLALQKGAEAQQRVPKRSILPLSAITPDPSTPPASLAVLPSTANPSDNRPSSTLC